MFPYLTVKINETWKPMKVSRVRLLQKGRERDSNTDVYHKGDKNEKCEKRKDMAEREAERTIVRSLVQTSKLF